MLMMPSVCPNPRRPDRRARAWRGALLGAALATAGALAPAADAEQRLLTLDPEESSVTFTLGAIMHKVDGRFRVVSGEILFDPVTGTASGEVVIDATSGDTGNGRRDRRMHEEILDSERFSRVVLRPTAFSGDVGTSGGGIMLSGELEAHGHKRSVDIPAWVTGIDGDRLRASGGFDMPYTAWGIPDPSGFFLRVSSEVEIHLEIVGDLSTPAPGAAQPGNASGAEAPRARQAPAAAAPEPAEPLPADAAPEPSAPGTR